MSAFSSHLTVLKTSASRYSSSPVFRIPTLADARGEVEAWVPITYQQFHDDVELVAKHWATTLKSDGLSPGAVVGLWLTGWSYSDVLQLYGLSRAGYIPQLFSLKLPNPEVVFELLGKSQARALIYEPSFGANLVNSPVPLHSAVDVHSISSLDYEQLPPLTPPVNGDDLALVFHTSGSTSGSPKLVPCSYRWLDSIIHKARQVSTPRDPNRQDVTTWMGSTCHIGQTFMFLGFLQHGGCTIQTTQVAFSSDELADMIERCGLNRLNQFATFLSIHLRNSRLNPKLLGLLKSLDEILYSGLTLGREEEAWAYQNGILLKNLFGSTECGAMMLSIGGRDSNAPLLRPLEGVSYGFFPVESASSPESDHKSTNAMLEMVILSQSADCPDRSLRAAVDGHFHTGDLFEEVAPGSYVFRGRDDDWIKSEAGLRCDTKAIEDNVRATCPELIAECVVVGNGRPSPALFVEPACGIIDQAKLKSEILCRTREFHSRRYLHERITKVGMIIAVERGTLPRTATKGNIRRRAVEEAFKEQLDQAYGVI